MPYTNCPRCGLSMRSRATNVTLEHCPRCQGRAGIAIPMYVAHRPAVAPVTQPAPADELAANGSGKVHELTFVSDELGPEELVIRSEREADALVLALYGELDLVSAPLLERRLREAELIGGRVVVDLSGLEFMDSTGLYTLLRAQMRCRENGCRLSLLRGPRQVQRVFELSDTRRAFSFDD